MAVIGGGVAPGVPTPAPFAAADAAATDAFRPQQVTVSTPTGADGDRLVALGPDLTEHTGQDRVEVLQQVPVVVDRGQRVKAGPKTCAQKWSKR
ncbi:hypothetical protein SUDANB6_05678 [Streptomyces sp. enrichment culture]|uniref:hypothetical protein n=1 Tax=Streptomyces sp. enrichment culture TaxID=1795815 RepID=UPI003F562383